MSYWLLFRSNAFLISFIFPLFFRICSRQIIKCSHKIEKKTATVTWSNEFFLGSIFFLVRFVHGTLCCVFVKCLRCFRYQFALVGWRCRRCLCSPTRTQNYYGIAFSFFLSIQSLKTWTITEKMRHVDVYTYFLVLSFAYSDRAHFFHVFYSHNTFTLVVSFLARHSQSDIVNCMSNKRIKNRINEPLRLHSVRTQRSVCMVQADLI